MTNKTTTRRAVLAGAAAIAAGANVVPAVALAPDPIFATIETHKAAYKAWAEAVHVESELHHKDPRMPAADKALRDATDACDDAGRTLATLRPTTIAGVLALLDYIDTFNHAAFKYPSGSSGHHAWPWREGEDAIEIGAPIVLPFPYLIMNNVRDALAKMPAA